MLLVTTFSKDLYDATGKRFVESYKKHCINHHKLLCCYEEFEFESQESKGIYGYDLLQDINLTHFLEENKDVIPDYLGGNAIHCECKDWQHRHCKNHVEGCHYHWMNRNASRWFRKVVSQVYAFKLAKELYEQFVIWIDSDSTIVRKLPTHIFVKQAEQYAVCYFKGPDREAPEVGIVIYNLAKGAIKFMDRLLERYMTKYYLEDHRWDDGFQFGEVIKECIVSRFDIANTIRGQNVIPQSWIEKYIQHRKGTHGRIMDIMK